MIEQYLYNIKYDLIMSKEIQLTQGKVTIVDDDLFEEVNKFKWHINTTHDKNHNIFYACRWFGWWQKRKLVLMHLYIYYLKTGSYPEKGLELDHVNHDGLDNRFSNLRLATGTQNQANKRILKNNNMTSKYKGVSRYHSNNNWQAQIQVSGKKIHLGYFDSELEAAHAHDTAARLYSKEFAYTNMPELHCPMASIVEKVMGMVTTDSQLEEILSYMTEATA